MGHTTETSYEELITNARASARTALRREISEPQAALAVGVVVGDRTQLSDEIINAFRRTGTTHILAISGQNITALIGIILLIWSGNQRRRIMPVWLLIASVILIIFYTGCTGASPSVVRAAIMGIIVLIAPLVHRRYDPMAALALSAAGMVFLDPDVILDAGFQLSFLAMWGLVVFSPSVSDALQRIAIGRLHFPRLLAYPLAVGISAQIATLPLIMVISGQFSLVSLFASMTADITLVPLMMAGIFTASFGSIGFFLFNWLASLCSLVTWISAAWMLWWVEWWSSIPWAALPIENFNPNYALVYYAALFPGVWLFSEYQRNTKHERLWPSLRLSVLGATAIAIWTTSILILLNK